jgi:hypothetical protein
MTELDLTKPVTEIDRADWLMVATLVAIWGLMAILVNPIGDFPLNDDWGYGLPVKWLVEDGQLRFTDWQSHPLITQVLWGSLFALPAGFSFTALRFSTLMIASLGLGATYLTAREAGLARPAAMAIAVLFLVNPVFVSLSNTFMSDVPNFSLGIVSIALLTHGLKHDHAAALWAGWLVVLLASLIRQPTLAIAIGLVLAMALKDGLNRRWLVRAVLPAVLVILGVVVVYPKLLQATIGLPALYHARSDSSLKVLGSLFHFRLGALKPLLWSLGYGLMNVGLWMLPLLVLDLPRWTRSTTVRGDVKIIAAGCGAAVVTVLLWAAGLLMPLGAPGNILLDFGAGVRTLRGETPSAPRWFWLVVTVFSAFGSVLIVLALGQLARNARAQIRRKGGFQTQWLTAFFLSTAAIYYAPVSLNYGAWFDRYALMAMILMAILFASLPSPSVAETWAQPFRVTRTVVAGGLALVYLGFAIASTHDYLDWNRQRWTAGLDLISRRVIPAEIDGGFEFNNYLGQCYGRKQRDQHATSALVDIKTDPKFVLSFSDLPGYTQVRQLAVYHWLPMSPDHVLVLERWPTP